MDLFRSDWILSWAKFSLSLLICGLVFHSQCCRNWYHELRQLEQIEAAEFDGASVPNLQEHHFLTNSLDYGANWLIQHHR